MFALRRNVLVIKNSVKWQCHKHKSDFVQKLKANQVPIWAGLSVIALFQLNRIRTAQNEALEELLKSGRLEKVSENNPLKVHAYNSLPLESVSRFVGHLSRCELPKWLRTSLLGAYCRHFGVKIEEAVISDLSQYRSVNEFFRRKLRPECRPIDVKADLVSPCDGKVLHCGPVSKDGLVEQVLQKRLYQNLTSFARNCLFSTEI